MQLSSISKFSICRYACVVRVSCIQLTFESLDREHAIEHDELLDIH